MHVVIYLKSQHEMGDKLLCHCMKKDIGFSKLSTLAVYTNHFYDTSVIFSNFIITYKEPFIGPT